MNKPPREFNKESARLILAALKFSAFREQSIEMENKLLDDRDVNAIIYYIEKRHVELEAYDQLKKENEELIYKNWALKNAYDNVDDKNTKLKEWKSYYEKKFAAGIFLTNDEYAELHEKIRALELKIEELENYNIELQRETDHE